MRTLALILSGAVSFGLAGCGDNKVYPPPGDEAAYDGGDGVGGYDAGGRDDAGPVLGRDGGPTDGGYADGGPVDGGGYDGGNPVDGDPACSSGYLVIAEIDPGETFTVLNGTGSDVSVAASGYYACARPAYSSLADIGEVIIRAGETYTFTWPAAFPGNDAGGELALYTAPNYGDAASVADFVCWGDGLEQTRIATAMEAGKWLGTACTPAVTPGATLKRRRGTSGTGPADYDPTGAEGPILCE